jgi:hypothetical protein
MMCFFSKSNRMMRRTTFVWTIILLVGMRCSGVRAQSLQFFPISSLPVALVVMQQEPVFFKTRPPFGILLRKQSILPETLSPIRFGNNIPSGAVFCRMENSVYERYNVWVKIRAGDEDSYRRMIEKP